MHSTEKIERAFRNIKHDTIKIRNHQAGTIRLLNRKHIHCDHICHWRDSVCVLYMHCKLFMYVCNESKRERERMCKINVSPCDLELVAYLGVCVVDDEGGGGSSMLISEAPRNNDNLFGRDSLTWPQLNTSYIDEDILCKSKHQIIHLL